MKRTARILAAILLVAICLSACSSKEPCAWCDKSPTKAYRTSSGDTVYVCKDCSSTCIFCGKPATKHYTSLLGEMFVCGDCYEARVRR
ncbi:MAG TPA: hypothetical protein IAC31_09515 [Candidatus Faecousia intestinigallinarum]|nr:hypothetical protein [Candidatus Faecousia intestinigallinarum]